MFFLTIAKSQSLSSILNYHVLTEVFFFLIGHAINTNSLKVQVFKLQRHLFKINPNQHRIIKITKNRS